MAKENKAAEAGSAKKGGVKAAPGAGKRAHAKKVAKPAKSMKVTAAEKKAEKAKANARRKTAETAVKKETKEAEKAGEEKAAVKATKEEQLKAYDVIFFPLITEKAVNMIEAENKLSFIINGKATKSDVKNAVEALYGAKVDKVNIIRDMKARKRAVVKINKSFKAEEIATRLGVL